MESRSEPPRGRYYTYNQPCGNEVHSLYKEDVNHHLETVESWRGSTTYVQVGSKKRKSFHEFERYVFGLTDQNAMTWCPEGSSFTMWAQDFPWVWMQVWAPYALANYLPHYYEGSTWPLITKACMENYGEDIRDFVVQDLFVKVKEPRFDGAKFLAELTETLVSIRDLFVGTIKFFWRAKDAIKTARHLALNTEELWLWWRYALMPAMLDAEALIGAISPQAVIDRVQSGDRMKWTTTKGTTYSRLWSGGNTLEIPWEMQLKHGSGGAIDILSRFDPHQWGDSGWDGVRAAWEVIPFSFIIDWFVNVGAWLDTLRELDIVYAQSYATYAVDAQVTLFPGTDVSLDFNPTGRMFLQKRIINVEPPPLPLVDARWLNTLRVLDSISLSAAILKGIVSKGKPRKRKFKSATAW